MEVPRRAVSQLLRCRPLEPEISWCFNSCPGSASSRYTSQAYQVVDAEVTPQARVVLERWWHRTTEDVN